MIRALIQLNLVFGTVGHLVLCAGLWMQWRSEQTGRRSEREDNPETIIFAVLFAAAAVGCILLFWWCNSDQKWNFSNAAKKWMCFLITPWGMLAGLGVGFIIVGIVALTSSNSGSGGGLSYQQKRDIRDAVDQGASDAIRRNR